MSPIFNLSDKMANYSYRNCIDDSAVHTITIRIHFRVRQIPHHSILSYMDMTILVWHFDELHMVFASEHDHRVGLSIYNFKKIKIINVQIFLKKFFNFSATAAPSTISSNSTLTPITQGTIGTTTTNFNTHAHHTRFDRDERRPIQHSLPWHKVRSGRRRPIQHSRPSHKVRSGQLRPINTHSHHTRYDRNNDDQFNTTPITQGSIGTTTTNSTLTPITQVRSGQRRPIQHSRPSTQGSITTTTLSTMAPTTSITYASISFDIVLLFDVSATMPVSALIDVRN